MKKTYLEFKNKKGEVVSVAEKTEIIGGAEGDLKVHLVAPPDQTVTTVDETTFKAQKKKLGNKRV